MASTRDRLLLAAIKLFALYGYEGTTTRAITSDAKANLQSIPFYFESKENLYKAAVEKSADIFIANFASLFQEIDETIERGLLNKEASWNYIVEIVSRLSEFVLDQQHRYEFLLIGHNLFYPSESIEHVMEKLILIYRYFAELLLAATGSQDEFWANSYSYMVLSSFFTYSNMPAFLQTVIGKDLSDPQTVIQIRTRLKQDTLVSISHVLHVYGLE